MPEAETRCREISGHRLMYFGDRLPPSVRDEIHQHLYACPHCRMRFQMSADGLTTLLGLTTCPLTDDETLEIVTRMGHSNK